jgi:hypothetical protein
VLASVDRIVEQLVARVAALTEAVEVQDAEVRELRGRLDGVRTLLGKQAQRIPACRDLGYPPRGTL